jgi:hypothetical protein
MNLHANRRSTRQGAARGRHPALLPNDVRHGRVKKTLWPPQPGTVRLLERFGAALLCVRYREDPSGLRRYVTVEIVVESGRTLRARRRGVEHALFPLGLAPGERELRATIKQAGAQWHPGERLWYLPAVAIRRLGLEDRICIER